jgi:hypothetical protein
MLRGVKDDFFHYLAFVWSSLAFFDFLWSPATRCIVASKPTATE